MLKFFCILCQQGMEATENITDWAEVDGHREGGETEPVSRSVCDEGELQFFQALNAQVLKSTVKDRQKIIVVRHCYVLFQVILRFPALNKDK